MSQVSITDIAAAAGVSPSTVSRALQDHPRISPARRQAIQALAQQMGYRPSQVARSLVTGRTRTLGVVITDVTDPFVAEVLKGAELASRESGYTLLFASSDRDPDREIEALRLLLDRQVDGMIVISGRAGSRYAELRSAGEAGMADWPLVLVNNDHTGPGIYSVRMDNAAGAHEAVSYLRRLGHQRIAFLSWIEMATTMEQRRAGYRQALLEAGLVLEPELEWEVRGYPDIDLDALEAELTRPGRPTAVFAANDQLALAVQRVARSLKLAIPEELSLVGFDNLEISAHVDIPITTVAQPAFEIGRSAGELLLYKIKKEVTHFQTRILPVQLVVRRSCGVINQK